MESGEQSEGFRGESVRGGGSRVMDIKEGTCCIEY